MTQHPIAVFLHARYTELEQKARAAARVSTPPWRLTAGQGYLDQDGELTDYTILQDADGISIADDRADFALEEVEHFAAHDPAYVLADIAAKRDVVQLCDQFLDPVFASTLKTKALAISTLKLLAAPFDWHPEYRPEWRVPV